MILTMNGETAIEINNFRRDVAFDGSKKTAVDIVIDGEHVTPSIIRTISYGNLEKLTGQKCHVGIMITNRLCHTPHTRLGFVDMMITTKPAQFFVYMHAEFLESFFGAFAMSVARTGLRL